MPKSFASLPNLQTSPEYPFITSSVENTSADSSPIEILSPERQEPSNPVKVQQTESHTTTQEPTHTHSTSAASKQSKGNMVQVKIRPFRGLRDGKEDPQEYIEDLEWAYDQENRADTNPSGVADKAYRLLFRQNLENDAWTWYSDLDRDVKQDWGKLKGLFLASYVITEKDAQAKKFELRMKVAQLKQNDNEDIADYLKRASDLSRKMPTDEIEIGMATLRGMHDQHKREQVNFQCNKDSDYSFTTVEKLIKAAYSEIGKPNPFDPTYRDSLGVVLPSNRSAPSQADLVYQAILNQNQAWPTLLNGIRHLLSQQPSASGPPSPRPMTNQADQSRPPRDLSNIKCFVCGQYGHYASVHNSNPPKPITANAATASGQQQSSAGGGEEANTYYPHPVACLLPVRSEPMPVLAAQRPDEPSKPPRVLQRPTGVKKPTKQTDNPTSSKVGIQHMVEKENAQNHPEYEPMDDDEDEDGEIEELASPSTFPTAGNSKAAGKMPMWASSNNQASNKNVFQNPPQTRVSKTGKVQELINAKPPTIPDPIRGMAGRQRFDISKIFDMPINLSLGQLCDHSDTVRHELAYNIIRSTPRYRVKKATKQQTQAGVSANMAIVAPVQKEPPEVITHALEDDGQSQPLMITAWVGAVKILRTLADGGSIVELVNRLKLQRMSPPPPVHTDGHLRVSLATDVISTLTTYVYLPVNVQGVQAIVKAWIVENQVYDLLLGIPWMRRVGFVPDFGTGEVTIRGADRVLRHVPAEIFPIKDLPTVELDETEGENDGADALCELLLEEQENE